MLNIGICEDSQEDQAHLCSALKKMLCVRKEEARIITYFSGEELLTDWEDGNRDFSLLFLDIFMNGLTGLETARKLRKRGEKAPIIFLTTSPDFALESYDVEATGYLLKPLREDKLQKLLERVLTQANKRRVCVLSNRRYRYLFLDEILFIESDNHSIRIHLAGGEVVGSSEKLGELAARLDARFLRCHQSFLVNMEHIADVQEDFVLKNGRIVPIRIRDRKAMSDAYYRFFVEYALNKKGGET